MYDLQKIIYYLQNSFSIFSHSQDFYIGFWGCHCKLGVSLLSPQPLLPYCWILCTLGLWWDRWREGLNYKFKLRGNSALLPLKPDTRNIRSSGGNRWCSRLPGKNRIKKGIFFSSWLPSLTLGSYYGFPIS